VSEIHRKLVEQAQRIEEKEAEIAALQQRLEAVEWVSVSERPPEDYGWYMVVDEFLPGDQRTMGFWDWDGERGQWLPLDCREDADSMQVTYWANLPPAPTTDGGEHE